MGKNTSNKVVKKESTEEVIDDVSQDQEIKDAEAAEQHVNKGEGTQTKSSPIPPQPSDSTTSLDQQQESSTTPDQQRPSPPPDQQQPSPSPLTPPAQTNEIDDAQETKTVPKKRSRKSTGKSAVPVPAKRKRTTRILKKAEKAVESENGVKIKHEASNLSSDVFSIETDDSEDVDELMPPSRKSSTKKKSSVNKNPSGSKKVAADVKNGTPRTRNSWQPDEDKILIDEILKEMHSPSWTKISQSLEDRSASACSTRWKTLMKRLYQDH